MNFDVIVKRISPKLKGITHKLNGHFTFFDEEDLYQEALLRLWSDYQKDSLAGKNDSYILQGCYFHLKNYIRKTYDKARLVSLENMISEEGETHALEDRTFLESPEQSLELIDSKMIVEKINHNGLTQREKEVFNLALEGLTTREIGNRLGISHVRVVKLKGRIKDKCRKHAELFQKRSYQRA